MRYWADATNPLRIDRSIPWISFLEDDLKATEHSCRTLGIEYLLDPINIIYTYFDVEVSLDASYWIDSNLNHFGSYFVVPKLSAAG